MLSLLPAATMAMALSPGANVLCVGSGPIMLLSAKLAALKGYSTICAAARARESSSPDFGKARCGSAACSEPLAEETPPPCAPVPFRAGAAPPSDCEMANQIIYNDMTKEGDLPLTFVPIAGPDADAETIEKAASSAEGLIIAIDDERAITGPALNIFMPQEGGSLKRVAMMSRYLNGNGMGFFPNAAKVTSPPPRRPNRSPSPLLHPHNRHHSGHRHPHLLHQGGGEQRHLGRERQVGGGLQGVRAPARGARQDARRRSTLAVRRATPRPFVPWADCLWPIAFGRRLSASTPGQRRESDPSRWRAHPVARPMPPPRFPPPGSEYTVIRAGTMKGGATGGALEGGGGCDRFLNPKFYQYGQQDVVNWRLLFDCSALGVKLTAGDTLQGPGFTAAITATDKCGAGDSHRGAVAGALVESLEAEAAANRDFSVGSEEGETFPSEEAWRALFASA